MKTIRPNFYNSFKCSASKCSDTCCAGWEIDIDEDTLLKYKLLKDDFREFLWENITKSDDNSYCYKLKEGDRCPFLDEKNLCIIVSKYGFEMTSEICRNHPRFFEWYGEFKDEGIGLCCEEGCRLLFQNEEKLIFEELETENE